MKRAENKQKLLSLPMNKLGLGGAFNGWFYDKDIQQSDVITLAEFISLNQCLKINKEAFICWRDDEVGKRLHRGLIKDSVSFKKLKVFLLKNNFTHKDWILLLPEIKTSKGMLPNLALLDKKILLELPYHRASNAKTSCAPANHIKYYFFENMDYPVDRPILVKDIINLTGKQIESYFPSIILKRSLASIQKRFKECGFTEKDGPFMKLNLPLTKSKDDYINDLIENKNFSKKDALIAVELGIRVGWIFV